MEWPYLIIQNLASCLNVFVGLSMKRNIMMTRASGFTKAGMERWSLYKKLSTLRVHITPNTAVQTKKKRVKLN